MKRALTRIAATVLLSILGFASPSVHGQGKDALDQGPVVSGGYQVTPRITQNSALRFTGEVPADADQILVTIQRVGERIEQSLFPVERRSFSRNVYLRQGPGDYSVKAYKCRRAELQCSWLAEFAVRNADSRDQAFLLPSTQVQSDSPEVLELAAKITEGARSDLERSKLIHDFVAGEIAYDTEAYFSGTYVSAPADASTVLRRRMSVCQGYSNLTAALHRAVGIRAKVVTGTAISVFNGSDASAAQGTNKPCNHAWNEVLVNGNWIALDTTWDAGFVDFVSQRFTFNKRDVYFNPPAEEWARTHRRCEDQSI